MTGCGGNQSNQISTHNNEITTPRTLCFEAVEIKLFKTGAMKSRPIYEGINQLERVIKNRFRISNLWIKKKSHPIFITIQNKHMKNRFANDVFFGVAEKYPVIRTKTLTPMIENAASIEAPSGILS